MGNSFEITILECARAVLEVTGSKSELRFEALPQDDPARRCPDITRARNLLDWEPQVQLKEGLQKSLDFFRGKIRSQARHRAQVAPEHIPELSKPSSHPGGKPEILRSLADGCPF